MVTDGVRSLWERMLPEQRPPVLGQLVIWHDAENGIAIDPGDIHMEPATRKETADTMSESEFRAVMDAAGVSV